MPVKALFVRALQAPGIAHQLVLEQLVLSTVPEQTVKVLDCQSRV